MMATITVKGPDGRSVRLNAPDDATPEMIQSKLADIKQNWKTIPQSAPQAQAPSSSPAAAPAAAPSLGAGETAADALKSFGIGLAQGGIGLVTTPGNLEYIGRAGIDAAARTMGFEDPKLSADTVLPTYSDAKSRIEEYTGDFYKPQSVAGEYARTLGEFAPLAAFGGGIGIGARAVNAAAPAVVSETAGQLTKGTSAEPWARAAGGLVGGFLPNAMMRTVSPNALPQARNAQVKLLENEGVTSLTAGQKTGAKPLRWAESVSHDVPFAGGKATRMQVEQAEQFTRAALRRAGVANASRATPEVIDKAFTDLGAKFDALASNGGIIADRRLRTDFASTIRDYDSLVPPSQRAPVIKEIADDLAPYMQTGTGLASDAYQALRSRLDRYSAQAKADPQLSRALRGMRDALDDAMERSIPPTKRGEWKQVRTQYRNLLAIEKALSGAGEQTAQGLISPSQLRTAVKNQNVRRYSRGKDDMGNLARAGEAVMKPLPQSGTGPRATIQTLLGAGGYALGDVSGALGAVVAPGVGARAIMSDPVQRYLSNQFLARPINAYERTRLNALERIPQAAMQAEQFRLTGGIGPRYDENGNPIR